MSVEQPALVFHPDFSTHHPGDIILRAEKGDDKNRSGESFYFSHSLLSALSSFFAGLPISTLPQDIYNGVPVIPLDTTSLALNVFLKAILSTSNPEPFSLTYRTPGEAVIDAALIGATFDCPIIFRLLAEAAGESNQYAEFYPFAIWMLVRKVPRKVEEAARKSLGSKIAYADRHLVKVMKHEAPEEWMRLLDFHIRRIQGMERFHRDRVPDEDDHPHFGVPHNRRECSSPPGIEEMMEELFSRAHTVEEVMGVMLSRYSLTCDECFEEAENWYGVRVRELMTTALYY